MLQGPEHVEVALKMIQSASEAIQKLGGVEEEGKAEALKRLTSAAALLRATKDRFFLKTKLCLPFARKCEEAARTLDALLAELSVQPAADAEQRLSEALQALERAAKTLDERSLMQGMAIT